MAQRHVLLKPPARPRTSSCVGANFSLCLHGARHQPRFGGISERQGKGPSRDSPRSNPVTRKPVSAVQDHRAAYLDVIRSRLTGRKRARPTPWACPSAALQTPALHPVAEHVWETEPPHLPQLCWGRMCGVSVKETHLSSIIWRVGVCKREGERHIAYLCVSMCEHARNPMHPVCMHACVRRPAVRVGG